MRTPRFPSSSSSFSSSVLLSTFSPTQSHLSIARASGARARWMVGRMVTLGQVCRIFVVLQIDIVGSVLVWTCFGTFPRTIWPLQIDVAHAIVLAFRSLNYCHPGKSSYLPSPLFPSPLHDHPSVHICGRPTAAAVRCLDRRFM